MAIVAKPKRMTEYPSGGSFEYLDTETTGLNPKIDRVISLGLVTVVNNKITARQEWFFNPGKTEISPEAFAVHGISKDFLKDKPRIEMEIGEILGQVMDKIIVAHNVDFDLRFMDEECKRFKLPTFTEVMTGSVCSMAMSKEKWPGKKAGLDFLLDRLKINRTGRVKHGALLDAELGALAMIGMGQKQMSMLEAIEDIPASQNDIAATDEMPAILIHRATVEEQSDHAKYLIGLNKEMKGVSVWSALETQSTASPAALPVFAAVETGLADNIDTIEDDLRSMEEILEMDALPSM